MKQSRCPWGASPEITVDYHDTEWGVPVHEEQKLFEFLLLETFQAGLSWLTILRKRENFRAAFSGFNPAKVARFGRAKIDRLIGDAGILVNEPDSQSFSDAIERALVQSWGDRPRQQALSHSVEDAAEKLGDLLCELGRRRP